VISIIWPIQSFGSPSICAALYVESTPHFLDVIRKTSTIRSFANRAGMPLPLNAAFLVSFGQIELKLFGLEILHLFLAQKAFRI